MNECPAVGDQVIVFGSTVGTVKGWRIKEKFILGSSAIMKGIAAFGGKPLISLLVPFIRLVGAHDCPFLVKRRRKVPGQRRQTSAK